MIGLTIVAVPVIVVAYFYAFMQFVKLGSTNAGYVTSFYKQAKILFLISMGVGFIVSCVCLSISLWFLIGVAPPVIFWSFIGSFILIDHVRFR